MELEKKPSNIKNGQIIWQYWLVVKKQPWLFFTPFVIFLIHYTVSVFVPLYYKDFFDIVSSPENKEGVAKALIIIVTTVLIIKLVNWLLWRLGVIIWNIMEARIIARLKQISFEYIIDHSYGFFANSFTGGLVQKINRFSRSFETLCDTFAFNTLSLIVSIVGSLLVTFFISKVVFVVLSLWVFLFIFFNLLYSKWKLKYDIAASEADSKTTGALSDAMTNNNSISLFVGQEFEIKKFKGVSDTQAKKMWLSWTLSDVIDAVQGFLIILVEFFVFYFAIKYWSKGLITVGVFVLAQTYIINLSQNLWSLSRAIRQFYQALADAKEMVEILQTPYEIKDIPIATELNVTKGEITFKNASFNFNQTREVLSDLNFTIKAGEKVALVGASGAGKTTLIRLIMRLYELTKGRIEIDGQEIHTVTQNSLRHNISLVPQDPILFHRTLMENIRYGRRDASDEEVIQAAKLAHCDEFIDSLSMRYETLVGERGIKLSGGERQRIAIARAILMKAPILILDEATSSLDSHSEVLIQDALDNLMKGCTTIVIAHRLSTIRKMDRIIALENGKIIEEGTHDDLIKQPNGLYKKLWELQAGGFVGEE